MRSIKENCFIFAFLLFHLCFAQDLSLGYMANDLSNYPMQELAKPDYLEGVIDPSFPGTTVRRISNAAADEIIVPMYSTIQSWNADESLMVIYKAGGVGHQLLNGTNYSFIRSLTDIRPADIENVFWDFNDPDFLYYLESGTYDFIKYNVVTQDKLILKNLASVTQCTQGISLGNDVQMMSWDSDVISFRCANETAYYYRISTDTVTQFNIDDLAFTAPMPFPSGNLFYHQGNVYNAEGNRERELNLSSGNEHSCLGRLSNGDDAYFAVAFSEGPEGDCLGTLVAHNATNANCFAVTPVSDYGYSQSGTHISALAHKNTEGGWVAVSMMGYDLDGQELLDQELFVAQVNENDAQVYRVAHHRSDENEFRYFGEPRVSLSPTGTRLLFGSDWSGLDDGISVDSYVAELSVYNDTSLSIDTVEADNLISIYYLPKEGVLKVSGLKRINSYQIFSLDGKQLQSDFAYDREAINVGDLPKGIFILKLTNNNKVYAFKFVV